MEVTAEGIETSEQAQLLKFLGCDKLQGFYFDVPAGEKELLRRQHADAFDPAQASSLIAQTTRSA